ncbi:ABC transporter permease [Xanthomonas arboricola]|uniref:ABC transporter permease n=1 Tax=Xanthomonas arboricola TaxID=56448 RepID=UPI000C814D77|nr:ABC transporter permease [Xanthomonas arboricola]PPU28740.1 hypothetical protein XarCFBP6762_05700 [Xanthomonas arboricola]SOT99534.1 ABC transporter permease [Xanthomonas arboricola pv. fragariae]
MVKVDLVTRDALQSWRALLRRPVYLVLVSLTLGMGIATTAVVTALLDQTVFRELPFAHADRLVTLGVSSGESGATYGSPGLYNQAKEFKTLESTGLVQAYTRSVNAVVDGNPTVLTALGADRGFIKTMGLPPVLGRNFVESEDARNGADAVIISNDLWRRHFDGARDVIGRAIMIEGREVPIVGVLSPVYVWPDTFDLITPLRNDPTSNSLSINEFIVGRLAATQSRSQLIAELEARFRTYVLSLGASKGSRASTRQMEFTASDLKDGIFVSRSGNVPWMFLAVAACVLVIALMNLTNLMVLRASSRAHDSAVRSALGATSSRLLVPQLSEAVLIGLIGGIAGIAIGWWGLSLLSPQIPLEWTQGRTVRLGALAIVSTLLIAQITAISAAMAGNFRLTRSMPLSILNESRGGMGRGAGKLAKLLIVFQIAAASVLLLTAALFGRSLQQLSSVPMGFKSNSITTFSLSPIERDQQDISEVLQQHRRISEMLAAQPSVKNVAASTNLPTGSQFNYNMQLPSGQEISAQFRPITPAFFDVFSIPLLSGRMFTDTQDRADSTRTCIVSTSFAKAYLSGSPLGQLITLPDAEGTAQMMRVVGVVGDIRQLGPSEPAPPIVYLPLSQLTQTLWVTIRDFLPLRYAVLLHAGSGNALQHKLPGLVASISNQQPISNVESMDHVVRSTTSGQRLNVTLVSIFSALALVLACVGLYAVLAYSIAARSHEFGVRAALGASPRHLLLQVLRESGRQLVYGLAIGLAISMAVSKLVQRFLFQTSSADIAAFSLVIVTLTLAWLAASIGPARRASTVDPMRVLRES